MPEILTPAAPLHLLIVEDKPLDAELMLAELQRSGLPLADTPRVETAGEYIAALDTRPDAILCDYSLPRFSAPDALHLLRERQLDIPFIIVSGSIGEETAVEAIKSGADDYLLKDRLGRLVPSILQAIEEKKLRAAALRAEEDLRQSEFKYRCLFEHLPDAGFLCDARTGKIIDVNRRGEQLLGRERASILGLRLRQFLSETASQTLLAADAAAPPAPFASSVTGAQGRQIPVQISATFVPLYGRRLLLTFFRETAA